MSEVQDERFPRCEANDGVFQCERLFGHPGAHMVVIEWEGESPDPPKYVRHDFSQGVRE